MIDRSETTISFKSRIVIKLVKIQFFSSECKHPSKPKVLFVFLTFRALKVRLVLVFNLKRTLESNGFLLSVFDVLAVFSVIKLMFFAFSRDFYLIMLFLFHYFNRKFFCVDQFFFCFFSKIVSLYVLQCGFKPY